MRDNFGRSAVQGAWILPLALALPFAARAANEGEIRNYIISINRLYERLNYESALRQIQLSRQLPRGMDEEVTLTLYEGIILYEMGRQDAGAAAFRAALLLRPGAKLPVQVAPKVEALFESVRKQVKQEVAPLLPQHGPALEKQEGDADKKPADTSKCQAAVSADCERLLKQILYLQEKLLRSDSLSKPGPHKELARIGEQLRAARTSAELQEAARALGSWQQRQFPP